MAPNNIVISNIPIVDISLMAIASTSARPHNPERLIFLDRWLAEIEITGNQWSMLATSNNGSDTVGELPPTLFQPFQVLLFSGELTLPVLGNDHSNFGFANSIGSLI